eukprot:m.437764 g.437764  ORF g.437764 m.437764 type:complete len:118 (-) comp20273_c1_seq36:310-663(-)
MFRPLFQYYFDYVTTQVAVATHAGLRAGMAVAWRSVAVRLFPQQLPRRFLTTSQLRLCSEQPLLPETTVASTEPMEVDVVANKRFSWCTASSWEGVIVDPSRRDQMAVVHSKPSSKH